MHITNLYHYEAHVKLAELLIKKSFADRIFFCNSGTEAVEASIKFARKYYFERGQKNRYNIVSFYNAFHGRTYVALSATPQKKYQTGFGPMCPGFKYLPAGNVKALKKFVNSRTAAVIIEPLQGEGGVRPIALDFLRKLRAHCNRNKVLLIFDEIQCGLGRTGKLWGHEWAGVKPDIMVLAKPLGGGLPLGSVLMKQNIADCIKPGEHGTTFGGNPVACSAGYVVMQNLLKPGFLRHVREMGRYLQRGLKNIMKKQPGFVELRGSGLIWGAEFEFPVKTMVDKFRKNGLICCSAGPNVLRFMPPLNVKKGEITLALRILKKSLE
jgi:predicted acetylornithine/succinylornithine family transaminase